MALSNLSFAAVFVVAIVGCLIVMAIVWWRRPKRMVERATIIGREQTTTRHQGRRLPTKPPSLPRQFERQKRPTPCPALALAVTVAFVGELQANALQILLQAAGHSPGAI